MQIDQNLSLKQSQTLSMTAQMQQSIKLLQMPTFELESFILNKLEENPLLESCDIITEKNSSADNNKDQISDNKDPNTQEDYHDFMHDNYYNNSDKKNNFSDYNYSNSDIIEKYHSKEQSLKEFIFDQININIHDKADKLIAFTLTDHLDDNGYLNCNIDLIAQNLQCNKEKIKNTLQILQNFEPAGVFAQNLTQCLKLQLKDKNRLDPLIEKMLDNIDLIAKKDIKSLCKICKTSNSEIIQMYDEIKQLNPKPGSNFIPNNNIVITPDIFLKRDKINNQWILELNNDNLPKILVNKKYYSKISKNITKKHDKKFLSDKLNEANWLVKTLDQRANTILKVATEIVVKQNDFFEKGIEYLKPLILSDIATEIQMHESTISRVTNEKYIATNFGTFELKYFFSSAVKSNKNEDISSISVKNQIKNLISNEDKQKPLSDEKITNLLKIQGIDIARRTVMKYRESLQIPSSSKRKNKFL